MKYDFITAKKAKYGVTLICDVLDVRRDAYYKHCSRGVGVRAQEDIVLAEHIHTIWVNSRHTYGVPRIRVELAKAGVHVGKDRVGRLFKASGCVSAHTKVHRYRKAEKGQAVPNVLDRNFNPDRPGQVWVTDVTYFHVGRQWAYLVTYMDLFNREILGWAVSDKVDKELCLKGFRAAVAKSDLPTKGMVVHSDQGSTYMADLFKKALTDAGIVQSMSGRGVCWDNACAESFFKTIKTELEKNYWATLEELDLSVFSYIEGFYNPRRLHSALGQVSPRDYMLAYSCGKGVHIKQSVKERKLARKTKESV